MISRKIPSTGEELPVVGLGTWKVFDVSPQSEPKDLREVLKVMQSENATLIDSSPMYGHSEETVGNLTSSSGMADDFFYATKVWTRGREEGIRQMENSFLKMKRKTIDLMQVHNLVDWRTHLDTMRDWKAEGRLRYIGVTHYTESMHLELEKVIDEVELDFVQFNYSILVRNAEKSLLKKAKERGVATLINEPLDKGSYFHQVKDKVLPAWITEYGVTSWSQYFLLYIISHPAVTCIIPASGNPKHMLENLQTANCILPKEKVRKKMVEYLTG